MTRSVSWPAAVLLLLLAPEILSAADPEDCWVGPDQVETTWQGPLFIAARNGAVECFDEEGRPHPNPPRTGAGACDIFILEVKLPEGEDCTYWDRHDGRVMISLMPDDTSVFFSLRVWERVYDPELGTHVRGQFVVSGLNVTELQWHPIERPRGQYYIEVLAVLVPAASYTGKARFEATPRSALPPGMGRRQQQ